MVSLRAPTGNSDHCDPAWSTQSRVLTHQRHGDYIDDAATPPRACEASPDRRLTDVILTLTKRSRNAQGHKQDLVQMYQEWPFFQSTIDLIEMVRYPSPALPWNNTS